MGMFRGMEDMVGKKVQPVVESIEKKLVPGLEKLTVAIQENTNAVNRLTNAISKK